MVKELSSDVSVDEYIDFDREVVTAQPTFEVEDIAWRQLSRQAAINAVLGSPEDQESDEEVAEEEITTEDPFSISSISEALQLVDCVADFIRQFDDSEMSTSLDHVNDKLQVIMISNRKQKFITDFFRA